MQRERGPTVKDYARAAAERVAASTPPGECPTFPCIPADAAGIWTFYCPPCRCWHTHGAIAGKRAAHCLDGSPYSERGYSIELLPGLRVRDDHGAEEAGHAG